MANRTRTSAEIEEQIQQLLRLNEKALERENITKFTNLSVRRLTDTLKNHCYELSGAEIEYIFEPVANYERNVYKKKRANLKKEGK